MVCLATNFVYVDIGQQRLVLSLKNVSSGTLRRVALVSEEPSASFSRVTRIVELGTTLAVTSNRRSVGC
jgi:hypothetical protein